MRFLCLHGIGTNNQIFKMQTAAFRYELADQHTYEFVQGIVPWALPSGMETLLDPSTEHYAYYDTTSLSSFIAALDSLEAYVEGEGPFDGVVAYSQGAGLVAMLLVRRKYLRPQEKSLFKCAILFSPVQVYDPVAFLEKGEVKVLDSDVPTTLRLTIPVAMVYGSNDENRAECEGLKSVFDSRLLSVSVHDGGHEVPGIGARDGLLEGVKMARRAIVQAELSSST
ncbi:serine hydrolase FSH [Xylariomycetidae sp. FL0641]|nr:serine hydrolase FSH [Xylariomycetidae sp. FL0641]